MKRFLSIFFILLITLSLASCDGLIDPYATETTDYETESKETTTTTESDTETETESETEPPREPLTGVVLGFSNVDLTVPPYETEDGTVYADLAGFADYFGCSISYTEDGTIAMVSYGTTIYTFDVNAESIVVADVSTEDYYEVTLSAPAIKTDVGMDIPVLDFAALFDYTYKWKGGLLLIYAE